MARLERLAADESNGVLKRLRDPLRSVDEEFRRLGRADVPRRLGEEGQPVGEMLARNAGQLGMSGNRAGPCTGQSSA